MKAACDRAALLEGIQTVLKAVSPRSTLPILGNLLVETREGGKLGLLAYDLEMGIQTTVSTEITQPGALTIPARVLADVMSILPEAQVTITVDERHVAELACERSKYQLKGLPADEFPRLPQMEDGFSLEVPGDVLSKMVRLTRFASSTDDARPILAGVLTILDGNEIQLVATDGPRLAWTRCTVAGSVPRRAEVIVPSRAYGEVVRLIGSSSDPVGVTVTSNQISFQIGDACVQSRLVDGRYPNWERVIPSSCERTVTVELEAVRRAVRRVSIVAREDGNKVVFDVRSDGVVLSAESQEIGKAEEEVPAVLEGEPMRIAFNSRYLLQVLEVLECSEVRFELREPDSAGVVKPGGDDAYTYLLMPMVLP
jgi:DNA polymerase III subunit beta